LGSFGFALALGAPGGRKIGFALGSFGFVFGCWRRVIICVILCGDWVCGNFGGLEIGFVCTKKGRICRGYSTEIEKGRENAKIKMQNARLWRPLGRTFICRRIRGEKAKDSWQLPDDATRGRQVSVVGCNIILDEELGGRVKYEARNTKPILRPAGYGGQANANHENANGRNSKRGLGWLISRLYPLYMFASCGKSVGIIHDLGAEVKENSSRGWWVVKRGARSAEGGRSRRIGKNLVFRQILWSTSGWAEAPFTVDGQIRLRIQDGRQL
jgi:hypothetical protein